jgi:glycosyltransferase involved in cell wall biosynthesis
MPVYNDEKYIADAVNSVLNQSYKDFEFIIIDDHSTDTAPSILSGFKDKRLKVYRNQKNLGISKSRNRALKLVKGKYIFFTDSDCIADKNWLKEGLKAFKRYNCLGLEGMTYYIKKGYRPNISDKTPGTLETSGMYLGCNVAFTKDIMLKLNGYDEKYGYHEDRDFAIRVKKYGEIKFCDKMIVTHQKKLWTCRSYIKVAIRAKDRILLFKYHNDTPTMALRILSPRNLIKVLIPPLTMTPLFKHKNKTLLDYKLVLCIYVKCIYERIIIWRTAIKERVFVI